MPDRNLICEDFGPLATNILTTENCLRFRARGKSMRPFLWEGDILEIHRVLPEDLKRGDIVLCRLDYGSILTHRVVQVVQISGEPKLVIQGDALPQPDGCISMHQVLGKVSKVDRNGTSFPIDHPLMMLLVQAYLWLAPFCKRVYLRLISS